jgi:site-specific recombinase
MPRTPGARDRIVAALDRAAEAFPGEEIEALQEVVGALRPRRRQPSQTAERNVRELTLAIAADERRRDALRGTLLKLFAEKEWVHLLADSGVLSGEGFFTGLSRRLGHRLLPDALDPDSIRDVVRTLFSQPNDHRWVDAIPDDAWRELLEVLELTTTSPAETGGYLSRQVLEALQVVSYRVAAIGLEPELVRNYPAIERYESPFLVQSEEVRQLIRGWDAAAAERRDASPDDGHLRVLLDQCLDIVSKIRRQAEKTGASIALTGLILRLQQSIGRMKLLLELLHGGEERWVQRIRCFKQMVRTANTDNDLSEHWARHVELLALRVTGNAGRAGERYITRSRSEYREMARAAAGAGFFIAFMAMFKVWLSSERNAPFVEALQYSLNYGLGFVLIYVLHYTIATKQPAMTASHIAASLSTAGGKVDRLDGLADLVVRTVRSQLVAVAGNLIVVIPLSALLAYAVYARSGEHYVTRETAEAMLVDVSPIQSLALVHAGIAGVWLFLSGLIAGYYDNRAVYDRLRLRIAQRPLLRRWLGATRTERLAQYVEDHLGGIAGNFLFGVLLGSTGTLGYLFGLPLDIRHITFSSAYVGIAFVGLDWEVSATTAALSVLGIVGIGVMNLFVSFGLALYVAMRSQRVRFTQAVPLLGKLWERARREPLSYLLPPSEPLAPEGSPT